MKSCRWKVFDDLTSCFIGEKNVGRSFEWVERSSGSIEWKMKKKLWGEKMKNKKLSKVCLEPEDNLMLHINSMLVMSQDLYLFTSFLLQINFFYKCFFFIIVLICFTVKDIGIF